MRGIIASAVICGITAVIVLALWAVRDQHFGVSNVCLEIYEQCR
jgi:hypothetical protein